ncbi:MAG TPA: PfkB family carbohydrate kinase [Verrucomicrobiota bacterium]|nr:PfkB family carbohydrate kinase [Verrucomicrobiota bacterium]
MVARIILGNIKKGEVTLAGGWEKTTAVEKFVPEVRKGRKLIPVRLYDTPFTTLKWRIYEQQHDREKGPGGPTLTQRFDQDLTPALFEGCVIAGADLPPQKEVDVVVVADYGKGLLGQKDLRDILAKYSKKPFLLRVKKGSEDPFHVDLPWTLLLLNRDDIPRIVGGGSIEFPSMKNVRENEKDLWRVSPSIVEALHTAKQKVNKNASILLKLDREGAVLLDNTGSVHAIPVPKSEQGEYTGLGAGDCMMAHIAVSLVRSKDSLATSAAAAVRASTAYCRKAGQIAKVNGFYGVADVEMECSGPTFTPWPLGELGPLRSNIENAGKIGEELQAGALTSVELHSGRWYLPGFQTVHAPLGSEIVRLRQEIAAYVRSNKTRPFVGALCGEAGSGKTTLAKALASATGCEPLESNVAQWTSYDDFFLMCERIRSARLRGATALLFLDEVDALLAGNPIYPKLLAPLWDGSFLLRGEVLELGQCVFLLAGSDNDWVTRDRLLQNRTGGHNKLMDLVSRLSSEPIQIPPLSERSSDAVLVAIDKLLCRFPRVCKIERGVLKFLALSELRHGPRSIEQIVALTDCLANPAQISIGDFPDASRYSAHVLKPYCNWKDDNTPVDMKP